MDLFRCSMSPGARHAVSKLYTPDSQGRVYCGQGAETDRFEKEFANAIGLDRSPLGVNSASAGIDLALHMLGVGPGDEVICSPLTCTASNGSVVTRGAKIVWADINPITGNIQPDSVKIRVTKRTKAIIAVDWAGRACDYQQLRQAAPGIPIIEDAAHRLFAPDPHGDYVVWSFGPIKHLTTGGYGGALLTPPSQQKRAELLRWHGLDRTTGAADFRCAQDIPEVGYRYHMTDDQAVVGLANLPLALDNVDASRENAAWYTDVLAGVEGITLAPFDPKCDYWLFGFIVNAYRDAFMERMKEHGIPTSRVHARNDYHSGFQAASVDVAPIPGVDFFDSHQVNIPNGRWISHDEQKQVVEAIKASLSKNASILVSASGRADP